MTHNTIGPRSLFHQIACDRCGKAADRGTSGARTMTSIGFDAARDSVFGARARVEIELCESCLRDTLGAWLRVKTPARAPAVAPLLWKRWLAVTWLPEFNVATFAFLLHFPWEFLQTPLFEGMDTAPHWQAIKVCTRATLGDTVIALIAYWTVAAICGRRAWMAQPNSRQVLGFLLVGVVITAVIEWLALNGKWMGAWTYASGMPLVPGLGIGLSPLLQWLILPPVLVVLLGRQHRGRPL